MEAAGVGGCRPPTKSGRTRVHYGSIPITRPYINTRRCLGAVVERRRGVEQRWVGRQPAAGEIRELTKLPPSERVSVLASSGESDQLQEDGVMRIPVPGGGHRMVRGRAKGVGLEVAVHLPTITTGPKNIGTTSWYCRGQQDKK